MRSIQDFKYRKALVPVLFMALGGCATGTAGSSDGSAPALNTGLMTVEEYRAKLRQDSIRLAEEERARRLAEEQKEKDQLAAEQAESSEGSVERTDDTSTRSAQAEHEEVIVAPEPSPRENRLSIQGSPFTISRERPTIPATPYEPRRGGGERKITVKGEPRLVTVSFLDTDIRDVAAAFSAYSGRSILLGEGLTNKKITADIKNQPWHIALETLLAANGMEPGEDKETGIISIQAKDRARELEASERPVPEMIRLSYIEASEVSDVLSKVFSDIQITQLASTNSLLVSAHPETMDEVLDMVAALDVRRPTVTIQAKIINIDRERMNSLGFNYSLEDPSRPFTPESGLQGIGAPQHVYIKPSGIQQNYPPMLLNRKSNATLSLFLKHAISGTPFTFTSFIDALEGASLAEVEAAPVLTTMSGKSASIEVGSAFHVPTIMTPQAIGGGGGNTGQTGGMMGGRDVIRVGINLDVTPTVNPDGSILLNVQAKRSGGELGANGTVTESIQRGQTEIIVDNGQTVVFAGLSLQEKSGSTQGVPLLKDIPLLGRLFQTRNNVLGEQEILIMVTPTIVDFPTNTNP